MDANDRENVAEATTIAERDRLIETLRGYGKVAVAFSGGVDSTVVAKAARLALGDDAVTVTAVSQSLAEGELQNAKELAERIGISHKIIETREFEDPNYLRNGTDRCYFCKSELYGRLSSMLGELHVDLIVSGANADDAGDHRPGLVAAAEQGVRHPLLELGMGKDLVRAIAKSWDLPTWDKPASPCLSSRIAYGEEVTPERARMIDQAEQWLRQRGLRVVRVRYHKGDLARVEVPADDLATLARLDVRSEMSQAFHALGFKFVTLDLDGFRSGSLNTLVPLDQLIRSAPRG
ncbi:MAG: ATP-dependent sacrificial sulfur transferase LarE [Isosphaeraceae bacterium]